MDETFVDWLGEMRKKLESMMSSTYDFPSDNEGLDHTGDVAQGSLLWRVPRLVGDVLSLSRWRYFDREEDAGCEAQALGTDYEEVRIVCDAAPPPAAPVETDDEERILDPRSSVLDRLPVRPQCSADIADALQDLKTHREAWRTAILFQQTPFGSDDDGSYWAHELRAFDRTFSALEKLRLNEPQPPRDHAGAHKLAELIADYTDDNLSLFDACDMPSDKAQELHDMAKALRDRLAPALTRPLSARGEA